MYVALLLLILASLCAGVAALIVHAKGRPDAVTLVSTLGLFFGPIGVLTAASLSTAAELSRAAERRAARSERS